MSVLTDAERRKIIEDFTDEGSSMRDCMSVARAIEAAVLAKVQREPAAWTPQSVLDAKKTTNLAPLWFSNPRNTAWTPLYVIDQPATQEGPSEEKL